MVVVDFGTAVTFDVVNARGDYTGGIIAPGLAAMTDYLHEKTALLPRIQIREIATVIGKSTHQAMLIGAVHGYRGLVRELIGELKKELGARKLPVVATGGYAGLIASKLPEITAVAPDLTLEGVRLTWLARRARSFLADGEIAIGGNVFKKASSKGPGDQLQIVALNGVGFALFNRGPVRVLRHS